MAVSLLFPIQHFQQSSCQNCPFVQFLLRSVAAKQPKALIWPQFWGDDKLQIVTNPKSNSLCKPPRIETLKRNKHIKKLQTPSISIKKKPFALSPAKLIRNTFGRSSGSHHLSFQPHQGLITITCDA